MVLRLLLILLLLAHPGCLLACDPYLQPQEMFSSLVSSKLSPAVLFLAADLMRLPDVLLPKAWESVDPDGLNAQFFAILMSMCGNLVGKVQDSLAGRAIITISPFLIKVSRNSLQTGGWQTMVLQASFPVTSKVVVYQSGGSIKFIDEIDSTTSFSLTLSWPPVVVKHFRIWKRDGLVFTWPEEDSGIISEGVAVAP